MGEPSLRVAVTGASGSLGRHVVTQLCAEAGVAHVLALDRAPLPVVDPKLAFARCDVRDADFARHLEGCDALIHLAFIVLRLALARRSRP